MKLDICMLVTMHILYRHVHSYTVYAYVEYTVASYEAYVCMYVAISMV